MITFTKPKDFNPKFSAVGIYVIFNKQILYLKYSKKCNGAWTLPSGKVNSEEDELHAVVRELFEETEIKIPSDKIAYLYTAFVEYSETKFLWHVYKCYLKEQPRIKLSCEHSEYVWVTLEQALKMNIIEHESDCLRKAFKMSKVE